MSRHALGEFSMAYKVSFVCPPLASEFRTEWTSQFQNHMPVLPNLQKELEDAYRKTLPSMKR